MANLCSNILRVSGDADLINTIVEATGLNRGTFDFNGLVPMPCELLVEAGTSTHLARMILVGDWQGALRFGRLSDLVLELNGGFMPESAEDLIELVERCRTLYERSDEVQRLINLREGRCSLFNFSRYGHYDWYSWSMANWGCKSNADYVEIDSLEPSHFTVRFTTAYQPPMELLVALCDKFPKLYVELSYAEPNNDIAGKAYGDFGSFVDYPALDIQAFLEEEFGHDPCAVETVA